MYDVHGVCTQSRGVSALIHGWLASRGQPRLATNFWTRSWFAAADGWTRLPRKVTRWPPGNVRSRTLTGAYRRLRALIPGAGLLLLPRVTVSNRTPVWLGLNVVSPQRIWLPLCRYNETQVRLCEEQETALCQLYASTWDVLAIRAQV